MTWRWDWCDWCPFLVRLDSATVVWCYIKYNPWQKNAQVVMVTVIDWKASLNSECCIFLCPPLFCLFLSLLAVSVSFSVCLFLSFQPPIQSSYLYFQCTFFSFHSGVIGILLCCSLSLCLCIHTKLCLYIIEHYKILLFSAINNHYFQHRLSWWARRTS